MKLKLAALGFGTSLAVALAAQAGTIGVFRIADGQIVEISEDGTQVLVENAAFKKLKNKAKHGDKVVLDGIKWTLAKNSDEIMTLQSEVVDNEFVDLLAAE
jgi:hypothetical protein